MKLTNRPCCDSLGGRGRLGLGSVGRTVRGRVNRRVEDVATALQNRKTRIGGVSCWRSQGRARRRKSESSEEDGREFHSEGCVRLQMREYIYDKMVAEKEVRASFRRGGKTLYDLREVRLKPDFNSAWVTS